MAASDQDPPAEFDMANIHMQILEEECHFTLQVPLGRRKPLDLLPAAREVTHQATAIAVRKASDKGKGISCKAGCGACCRQLVAISVTEAQALAALVASLPQDRQRLLRERFATAIQQLKTTGLLKSRVQGGEHVLFSPYIGERESAIETASRKYFLLQIPCPFLEDESCSIHPHRPLVCREYHVTSPAERCARLHQLPVEKVEPPLHMGDILARTVARYAGTTAQTIPLILSLEWVERHGKKLNQTHDGRQMFMSLLNEIDRESQRPFEKRKDAGGD